MAAEQFDDDFSMSHRLAGMIAAVLASGDLSTPDDRFPRRFCSVLLSSKDPWAPRAVAETLLQWCHSGAFPRSASWAIELFGVEQLLSLSDIENHTLKIQELVGETELLLSLSVSDCLSVENEVRANLLSMLRGVGPRVVAACLGMRTTAGCVQDALPPSADDLFSAFEKPHRPDGSASLTVGARALAKHCHRGSDGWWGKCSGSEAAKNGAATIICKRIIGDAIWINLHAIVGDVVISEYRVAEGYGARWAVARTSGGGAPCEFRGFLEPMFEGGHEKGWRH